MGSRAIYSCIFVLILLACNTQNHLALLNGTWEFLSDGILLQERARRKNPNLCLSEPQLNNYVVADLEMLLRQCGSSLSNFLGIPRPDNSTFVRDYNSLIMEEQNYDKEELRNELGRNLPKLTDEQRHVYKEIMDAVNGDLGGMFFVYGFGGTGKTFIWSVLGAAIRSEGDIVLNVASSGIAALLLKGGRTAHSRFGIPLNVNEWTICSMKVGSDEAELVKLAKLIIWDEAPMMSKHCFETLDRSLRDILRCDQPFGGKVIVVGGDFRQILPVVTDGGREQTVMSSLNASSLWKRCKVLKLTKNMRLLVDDLSVDEEIALRDFSQWTLDIGDGKIKNKSSVEFEIDVPPDLLITGDNDPIKAIVTSVYGESYASETDPKFFQGRAILSPRNSDVDRVNDYMLEQLKGEGITYLSVDSIDTSDTVSDDDIRYSQEFLNSVKISGLPNHNLKLKVGAPVILLRNIDPKGGLCNGF